MREKRKQVRVLESDSDSSHEQPCDGERKKKKKPVSGARNKMKVVVDGEQQAVLGLGQKARLSEMQRNNVLFSINPHYSLVQWWITEYSSHKGMMDPEIEEELLCDELKDTLYLNMCNTIRQRETEEETEAQQPPFTIEGRNFTNFTYLRRIMSTKDSSLSVSEESLAVREQQRAKIYFSSREWEEAYMRQPSRGEQECAQGQNCMGKKIENSNGGFVMVAYHFKHEVLEHEKEGKPLQGGRLCIFCLRHQTLEFFADACANQRKFNAGTVVQMHRNSVKEYHPHFMVIGERNMRQGLVDPIVVQTTNSTHYKLVNEGGLLRYKQLIPRPTKEELEHFLL